MPVCTSIERRYPSKDEYDAPKKYVLVLSCVDYRLLDDLIRFLDHDNLTNRYYHVALAGAALGAVPPPQSASDPAAVAPPYWRDTFRDHVRATVRLTQGELSAIYIVQHEDCGAFKLYVNGFEHWDEPNQRECNELYARALLRDLATDFCATFNGEHAHEPGRTVQENPPAVHAFYMDLRGNVSRTDSYVPPKETRCESYLCPCARLPGRPTAPPPREVPQPTAQTPPEHKTTRKAKR
jgi:hypothetical protein